ncbi:MAG TPA: YkgJ family cysteine cluster protein [Armatimonadota bacterium]|jgi:hypothetical protein
MAPPEQTSIDQSPCNGCTNCMHRCTAGIALSLAEYQAIRACLQRIPLEERLRVLGQDKVQPWPGDSDGVTYTACRFLDLRTRLCLVYEARPLICRLFGHVEWLPCPTGVVTAQWDGGPDAMRARAAIDTKTWEEWEARG